MNKNSENFDAKLKMCYTCLDDTVVVKMSISHGRSKQELPSQSEGDSHNASLFDNTPAACSVLNIRRETLLVNKNTSLMQLKSIYFNYSKSLHVSGRTLPIIRRI